MLFKGPVQSSDAKSYRSISKTATKLSTCRVRKAKAQMQLRLSRDVKCNTKCFYCYISRKRLNKENVSLLLKEAEDLVRAGMDEADILIAFFPSVFTNKVSQDSMLIERVQERKNNQQQIRIQIREAQ